MYLSSMRVLVVLAAIIALCSALTLQFLCVPDSVKLPPLVRKVRSSLISPINAIILGVTSKPVAEFPIKTDLFHRPAALVVVRLYDVAHPNFATNHSYDLKLDATNNIGFAPQLAKELGPHHLLVNVGPQDISGLHFNLTTPVNTTMKNLEQLLRLIAAFKEHRVPVYAEHLPAVYTVDVLGSKQATSREKDRNNAAIITNTIEDLVDVIKTAYNGSIVFEVVTLHQTDIPTKRPPRVVPAPLVLFHGTALDIHMAERRGRFQVYHFTSTDYPAMFLIITGVVLLITLTAVFTVVAMFSEDRTSNSILYRIQRFRMKRE